jgi:hypothetical protein
MTRVATIVFLTLLSSFAATKSFAGFFSREASRQGKTTLDSPQISIPAQLVANYLIISSKWDKKGPYNFLIDTGSSITLVSPSLARQYGRKPSPEVSAEISVRSADGEATLLPATSLKNIILGEASFENVPALIYDCSSLSVHLGMRVDGILGFPLFKELVLTLDYPGRKVLLSKPSGASALQPGFTLPFDNSTQVPVVSIRLGEKSFSALIDSGNDCTVQINPLGMDLVYSQAPRSGAVVTTLNGDRQQILARLDEPLLLGETLLDNPIVEISDELPAIGGGVLRFLVLSFDQQRGLATIDRKTRDPLHFPSRYSMGFSVTKAGAYWRIVGVLPESPASKAGIEEGDLITRINQEPVERWGPERIQSLIEETRTITFSFLVGKREYEMSLPVTELVP